MVRIALPLATAAVLAGCASAPDERTACERAPAAKVAAALARAGIAARALRSDGDESVGLSACHYRADRVAIALSVDTAPKARLRYFHRVTEQDEFGARDPRTKVNLIRGIADDTALGGAGAYWVQGRSQLVALQGDRIVIVTLDARGAAPDAAKRASIGVAQVVLGTSGPGRERHEAGPPLAIVQPTGGELLRTARVRVEGTVAFDGARVLVSGRSARVRGGVFAVSVPLARGTSTIVATATADGRRATATVQVRRGASPAAAAAVARRRAPGRVPDVAGERLDAALAILRAFGVRPRATAADTSYRDDGLVRGSDWRACFTRPRAGERVRPGARVLVAADRIVGRRGGTACDFY